MTEATKNEKKLDRRVVRTRKAIMRAYEKLLAEQDFSKITVSAISREADIDRKTFYLHYASVDDLANKKAESNLMQILEVLRTQGAGKSIKEQAHIALREVNAIVMRELAIYEKIASSLSIEQILDTYASTVEPALSRRGLELPIELSPDARMRLQFYLAGALSLYSTWLKSDKRTPIETVSAIVEEAIASNAFPQAAS
ncbi:MAG: TetR family transcriptional regulator [Eggerthellaceae bacterium]|nr:TetR family transcriptional regulator [Eggerthellaceae bacterium]